MVNIVLKREAREFIENNAENIDYLLIDGSLDSEYVKMCGCCGPPPSPDYKVDIIKREEINKDDSAPGGNISTDLGSQKKSLDGFVLLKKIVDVFVSNQMYDALKTARMNIVLFYLETVGEENSGRLVAKFI
ncbi:MAG: hypothetical protein ACTSYS_04720 [Promethearchaeota archaeon]